MGLFSALPQRGDLILYDELIHASVRDGIRLSFAKNQSFNHNDLEDLRQKLQRGIEKYDAVYVAVESLYSMDGDFASLEQIAALCDLPQVYLIVDEAHSAGVFGDRGVGLCASLGVIDKVFARLITFGKAYGCHGACVLGSESLKTFLLNFSRSFIYTTAMPDHSFQWVSQQVEASKSSDRKQLQKNIAVFRSGLSHFKLLSSEESPIQIIEIGDIEKVSQMAEKLQEAKYAVKPIYSPTVPKGRERLRICIHSYNTQKEIEQLISLLSH